MSTFTLATPAPSPSFDRAREREWLPVCVARLHYHLSWSTRGKSPVLTGRRVLALRAILEGLCKERSIQLQALAVTPSQVRLIVSLRPSQLAASIVRELKGRSALALLRQCPDVRVALGGNLAWNDHYALATVSPRQLARFSERLNNLGA